MSGGGGGGGNSTTVTSNEPWQGVRPFLTSGLYPKAVDLRNKGLDPFPGLMQRIDPTTGFPIPGSHAEYDPDVGTPAGYTRLLGVASLRPEQYNAMKSRQNWFESDFYSLLNRTNAYGALDMARMMDSAYNPMLGVAEQARDGLGATLQRIQSRLPSTSHLRNAYGHYGEYMPQADLRAPSVGTIDYGVRSYNPQRPTVLPFERSQVGQAPNVPLPSSRVPDAPGINIAPSQISDERVEWRAPFMPAVPAITVPRQDLLDIPTVDVPGAQFSPAPTLNIPGAGFGPAPTVTTPGLGGGQYGYAAPGDRTPYQQALAGQMQAGLGVTDPVTQATNRLMTGQVNTAPFAAATGAAQARTLQAFQDAQQQAGEAFRRDVMPALRQEFQTAGTYGGTRHQLAAGRAAERFADEQAQLQTRAQRELSDIATNMMMPAYQQAQQLSAQAAGLGAQNYFDTMRTRLAGAEAAQREGIAGRDRASREYLARLQDTQQRDIARADIGLRGQELGGRFGMDYNRLLEEARRTDINAAVSGGQLGMDYNRLLQAARESDISAALGSGQLGMDYRRLREQARQADIGADVSRGQLEMSYADLMERARGTDISGAFRQAEIGQARDELRERARQADLQAQIAGADVGLGFGQLAEQARQADIDANLRLGGFNIDYERLREQARQADITGALGRGELGLGYEQLRGNLGLQYQQLEEANRQHRVQETLQFQGMQEAARRGDIAGMQQMADLYDRSQMTQRQIRAQTAMDLYGTMGQQQRDAAAMAAQGLGFIPGIQNIALAGINERFNRGAMYREIDQARMDQLRQMHYEAQDLPWQNLYNYAGILQGNPGFGQSTREVSGYDRNRAAQALGGGLLGGGLGYAAGGALSNAAFGALSASSGPLMQSLAFAPLGPLGMLGGGALGALAGYGGFI